MLLFLVSSLFVAILISVIPFLKHKKSHNKTKQQLPPGQMGHPWIGETMEFYKSQRKNKLFEEFVLPRIRKHGNIFKTRLMGSPTVVVNGADANRFFLSNEFKLVISSWPSSSVQLMGKESIMESKGRGTAAFVGSSATLLDMQGSRIWCPKYATLFGCTWKQSGMARRRSASIAPQRF
jgi:hypothetical protein